MRYANPNMEGSKVQFKAQYENYIGGQWLAPVIVQLLKAIN